MIHSLQKKLKGKFKCLSEDDFQDPEGTVLDASTISISETEFESDNIVVMRGGHEYMNAITERPFFYASKESFRHLGLLIYSLLFHKDVWQYRVKLTHPKSDIKFLEFHYCQTEDMLVTGELKFKPFSKCYYPSERHFSPFAGLKINKENLPVLMLQDQEVEHNSYSNKEKRDRIIFRSHASNLGHLADLFLDISHKKNNSDCYDLLTGHDDFDEPGVGYNSAELSLRLPNHKNWDIIFK